MNKILITASTCLVLCISFALAYPVQEGVASYYGKDFHGKRTASGEIYNMYDLTAAHKTLPLGTLVEVTNLDTRKRIVVRINDRGPFSKERIIDLSYSAAQKIDMVQKGTARVQLKPLSTDWLMSSIAKTDSSAQKITPPPVIPAEDSIAKVFTIQLGAFQNPAAAHEFYQATQSLLKNVFINGPIGTKRLYKIQSGSFFGYEEAKAYLKIIHNFGYDEAFVATMAGD